MSLFRSSLTASLFMAQLFCAFAFNFPLVFVSSASNIMPKALRFNPASTRLIITNQRPISRRVGPQGIKCSQQSNNNIPTALDENLWQAAAEGDVEQIKSLISMGANVNAQQPYPEDGVAPPPDTQRTTHPGYTALHMAAMMNRVGAIHALAAAGAVLDARTEAQTTPLHVAAVHGRLNAVQALAELGADIKARNEFGADALRMAKLSVGRHKGTIALLEHLNGAPHEPWTDTAITGC